jgi:chromosomal replication initiator protein
MLASRITTNVRSLEGALIRLVAYGSLTRRPLDVALVAEVLDRLGVAGTATRPSIGSIQETVCAHFEITQGELLSRSRVSVVMWPRQIAMYLSKELTDHSLPCIAREFGGRDHTTVMHACRRVAKRIATSPEAYADVETLTATLTERR